MRAMKNSGIEWIGEIPEEWRLTRIGYLFKTIGSGTTPSSSDSRYYDGNYNWLQTGDLNDDIIRTTEKTITDLAIEKHSALRQYSIGSLVVAMYGATIGKLGLLNIPCYTNQACCVLEDPINVDTKYVYYWLFCNRQNLITFSLGGGQPNISQNTIREFKICLPSKIEQESIVSYLDTKCAEIDALIAAKEKTNALLKERRQSIIYEAVTKGLDPTVPMKDSGVEWIGEIPEGWELKRLKYLGSMQIGLTYSPEEIVADGALVLRSSNIQDGKIVHADDVFVVKEIPEKLKVEEGDILICSRNGSRSLIGKNAVITEEFSGQTFGAFMTIFRGRFNFYIKYLLNSSVFDYYVGSFLTSTINQLTTSNLGNILVPVPSTEEEMWKIAEHIETECRTIDPIIAMNNETIQKLKEYRQSLIYEAVTGKIEV